ncbi:MAG: hypothetical protein CXZ00_01840 [Acidobacteria bacterium]|nr:MAG: hypothetical protein CXZ00_01840 [Acidobacteriota bacterium]
MIGARVRRKRNRENDSGYMLLVLMLAVAVLTIGMLGVARNYRRSIQRDREVEMIHRGEQYARAVKRYYVKFGRYPISIEQLEKTNNIRFLRKKYKDPMAPDGEWKVAHPTDITIKIAGVTPTSGDSSTGTGIAGSGAFQTNFGDSGSTASGTQNTSGTSSPAQEGGGTASGLGGPATDASSPVLGGGPVLGVVSKSKLEGIHSFGRKTKYNEWFFIYVPVQDTAQGRLITGPYNPNMYMGGTNSGQSTSGKSSFSGGQSTTSGTSTTLGTNATTTPSQ